MRHLTPEYERREQWPFSILISIRISSFPSGQQENIYQDLAKNRFQSGPTGQGDRQSVQVVHERPFLRLILSSSWQPGYFSNQIAVLVVTGKTGTKDQTF